jgi:hypothetical protein
MTNQIQRAKLKNTNWFLGFELDFKFETWILSLSFGCLQITSRPAVTYNLIG